MMHRRLLVIDEKGQDRLLVHVVGVEEICQSSAYLVSAFGFHRNAARLFGAAHCESRIFIKEAQNGIDIAALSRGIQSGNDSFDLFAARHLALSPRQTKAPAYPDQAILAQPPDAGGASHGKPPVSARRASRYAKPM